MLLQLNSVIETYPQDSGNNNDIEKILNLLNTEWRRKILLIVIGW